LNSPTDECPFGEQTAPIANYDGMTCADVALPENQWRCYTTYVAKICCETCGRLRTNITGLTHHTDRYIVAQGNRHVPVNQSLI